MLYPGQIVLTTTLEYVAPPTDAHAEALTRNRSAPLGIAVNTMI